MITVSLKGRYCMDLSNRLVNLLIALAIYIKQWIAQVDVN